MSFDTFLMVDWSGGNDRGPKPKKDAIWTCVARGGSSDEPIYHRNRQNAEAWITTLLDDELAAGRRVFAGFDFAFGYPNGFGERLIGTDEPFAIWDWFAERVEDKPTANNRFDLAGEINGLFSGVGPFWGNGLQRDIPDLPRKGRDRHGHGMNEKRAAENIAKGAFPVWQLAGAGAVGSQVIMGLPMLARLRRRFDTALRVWPFEPLDSPVAIVEVWPSLIAKAVAATMPEGRVKDAHQVALLAEVLSRLPLDTLHTLLNAPATPEGSIFGADQPDLLINAAMTGATPPPLRNDCFAMPQGAHWTPVADALDHLRRNLSAVTGMETLDLSDTAGRFLAEDVTAERSHPPAANAAVDGYGFAGPAPAGAQTMPLVQGRAAAGQPYNDMVPKGQAIRILTGASIPSGVDTVILQEDVTADDRHITFHGPLKQGANTRNAGEDMVAGQTILSSGRHLQPGDLAMLAAAGIGRIKVRKRLRVGILSTGDELIEAGKPADVSKIYDANRPMLRAVAAGWGYDVIDLGRGPDDREALRAQLDEAAQQTDVILTSGGASAGDEDHISSLLENSGSLALWRVAMKPGRPLALGIWQGVPVFGLPGNPVAAMVCSLIFARPALQVLAGGDWTEPQGFEVPAEFAKSKKEGRREYLRARIVDGRAEIFPSEGSGRVSGLSWATGLVELDDSAQKVARGDLVRYLPFSSLI